MKHAIHMHKPTHKSVLEYPSYMLKDFAKGYRETACGYLRANYTNNPNEVTCFFCLKKLERENGDRDS